MTSFIGIYDNVLNPSDCGFIISQFENSCYKTQGTHGNSKGEKVVDAEVKQSIELPDQRFSNVTFHSPYIQRAVTDSIDKYIKQFMLIDSMFHFNLDDVYTFQKHESGGGGYKVWHCEHGPTDSRILAWQIFLNDSVGIEFLKYRNVKGRRGRVLIWPAGWTHMHRSLPNNRGNKYIVNGWASYDLK